MSIPDYGGLPNDYNNYTPVPFDDWQEPEEEPYMNGRKKSGLGYRPKEERNENI